MLVLQFGNAILTITSGEWVIVHLGLVWSFSVIWQFVVAACFTSQLHVNVNYVHNLSPREKDNTSLTKLLCGLSYEKKNVGRPTITHFHVWQQDSPLSRFPLFISLNKIIFITAWHVPCKSSQTCLFHCHVHFYNSCFHFLFFFSDFARITGWWLTKWVFIKNAIFLTGWCSKGYALLASLFCSAWLASPPDSLSFPLPAQKRFIWP